MGKVKYFAVCLLMVIISFIGFQSGTAQAATNENQHVNTAKPESTVPWEYGDETPISAIKPLSSSPVIADISKWQGNIDWSKASKALDLVIIRTQYGAGTEDYMHSSYEASATKYGVPFGVYSYVLSSTPANARAEARKFYNRASKNTKFYVLDVEEFTNKSTPYTMRTIIEAYVDELRSLTDKKVGLYVANHLYSSLNLKISDFDFVWIPRYSSQPPSYKYHLWQYTDRGRVPGIGGNVDLNRLASGVSLNYFTGSSNSKPVTTVSNPSLSDFYTSNPKKVIAKSELREFTTTAFKKWNGKVKKGEVVKVKRIVKTSNGTPRLQLTNGRYISANKKYVLKASSNIDNYYTVNDNAKYVLLKQDDAQYSSVNFSDDTRRDAVEKGKVLKVSTIAYTKNGTPRIKLTNGRYLTAKKTIVQKIKDTTTPTHYYTSLDSVKHVLVKADEYAYSSTAFNEKTRGASIDKNDVVDVQSVTYSDGGVPRLKLTNGRYMTAKKEIVQKVASDIQDFYTAIPQKLVATTDIVAYDGLYFGDANEVKTIAAGTEIQVKSIVYTTNGYSKFILTDNSVISTEKALYE